MRQLLHGACSAYIQTYDGRLAPYRAPGKTRYSPCDIAYGGKEYQTVQVAVPGTGSNLTWLLVYYPNNNPCIVNLLNENGMPHYTALCN